MESDPLVALALPTASVNVPAATVIVAVPVNEVFGVNVAE
jgi:ABC-type sulfate transport system permease subunit